MMPHFVLGTGKSCLLHRFIEDRFVADQTHTIGVEFGAKIVTILGMLCVPPPATLVSVVPNMMADRELSAIMSPLLQSLPLPLLTANVTPIWNGCLARAQ